MLLRDFLREGTAALEALYPAEEARRTVQLLCQELLGVQSYTHVISPEYAIPPQQEPLLADALRRLASGEPLQYVTGWAPFYGRRFRVTPSVLIPRPETELLVQEAVRLGGRNVLDLCTGSGCIAWSVALELPGARVTGVDVSEEALAVARGQQFPAAPTPTFVRADVLDTAQDFPYGPFDLILSNPPYVLEREKAQMRPNVLEHEPALALFVPDTDPLLFYRAIAAWSQRFLTPEGKGLTEINQDLGPQTEALFRSAGFSQTRVLQDWFGRDRFVYYAR